MIGRYSLEVLKLLLILTTVQIVTCHQSVLGFAAPDPSKIQNEQHVRKRHQDISKLESRRNILNFILSSAIATSSAAVNPGKAHALFGQSPSTKKEVKATVATDIAGSPIIMQAFLSKKRGGSRTMVQGLKGDPTYLIVKTSGDGIESFALNAECTHLGCVVPWDPMQEKFVCPCHGSQYDAKGLVLRGPAPGPLKLAKVDVEEESGKVLLEPWMEDDFRTGTKPWWI